MNSLIQVNEDSSLDFQTIKPKLREQLKSYSFYIFHNLKEGNESNSSNLQKLSFKLKQDRGPTQAEGIKQIFLYFADTSNNHETQLALIDLKLQSSESKTKIIIYGCQSTLISIVNKASALTIDLNNIPFALYSSELHNDLSMFIGWQKSSLSDLSLQTASDLQQKVKQWITSPAEKIDLWEASVSVKEGGKIFKIESGDTNQTEISELSTKLGFLSHLSIGYHCCLAMEFSSARKRNNSTVINKLIYGMASWKKFCCVGNPNLQAATGVVNCRFKDQKGHQIQLFKEFKEQVEDLKSSKKSSQRILSLALMNIDRYHGDKLKDSNSRMGDSKLELVIFQSAKQSREIASVTGEVTLSLQAEEVALQIGSTYFRVVNPHQIKIRLDRKIKVLINKDTLQC